MKISIDPGLPTTLVFWESGYAFSCSKIDSPVSLGRHERLVYYGKKITKVLGIYATQTRNIVALELMGESGPTFKKASLISLATTTGVILGAAQALGFEVELITTGANCKTSAAIVCGKLKTERKIRFDLDLTKKADSHKRDAILIGFLAGFDDER